MVRGFRGFGYVCLLAGSVFLFAVGMGCSERCVPGASARCACQGGVDGVQICRADGTFGVCGCGSEVASEVTKEVTSPDASEATNREQVLPREIDELKQEGRPLEVPLVSEEMAQEKTLEKIPESLPKVEGTALFQKLAGLWVGMASRTPLGTFAMTTMDLRDASPYVLFSRSDLDAQNNLRFAFSIETHGGKDVLIYRNGGYFQGILRDSRTELITHDATKSLWRFCSIGMGCNYLDATFTFPAATQMVLDVKVRGRDHMYWQAERKEERVIPQPFPKDFTSQGTGEAPFPAMPSLKAKLTWTPALPKDAFVWFVLSTTACGITLQCTPSRSIRVPVKVGATSAEVEIDQVHGGKYFLNAILDRNSNAATTFFPDSGDGVGQLDVSVDIKLGQTNSASSFVVYNFP